MKCCFVDLYKILWMVRENLNYISDNPKEVSSQHVDTGYNSNGYFLFKILHNTYWLEKRKRLWILKV